MSSRSVTLSAIALALALSGCAASPPGAPLGTDPTPPQVPPFEFHSPLVLDHDHSDLAEHNVSNAVTLIGHEPVGAMDLPAGGVGEIDVAGNYAYVAIIGYGFAIVDVSDPSKPDTVARVQAVSPDPIKYAADIKVDASGDWVFLAMELSSTPGLLIYDARDRAAPQLAGIWVAPGTLLGCHMIEYAQIGGQEYVFCAPLDNAIYVGLLSPETAAPVRAITTVARFVPNSPGAVMDTVQNAGPDTVTDQVSGHQDMTFQLDPLTGTPMLYVSFWNFGVRFVDVAIPAAPIEVGFWDGATAEWYRGLIHTTMAFESEGHRIVIAIPEVASPPALFVLDATDFAAPVLLSEWRALEDFAGQDTAFSMHNFQIVDGKIYLAMYHGGLWVLDVSTPENQTHPHPVGSYLPHEMRADGNPYSPGPWDVVVWNGYMLTADGDGGFYVLHHDGDPAGDPAYASFA